MKVLFTTPAGLGHIHPTVPLARAMVERGHTVLWAVPPDGVEHVKEAGIQAVSAGVPGGARLSDFWTRYPEVKALPPADRPDVMFGKLFGAVAAPPMLADLAPVALDWRPDLIVADAAELAGPIVAAELGVPNVTKGFGPVLPETRVANAAEEVAPLWRSRGLEPRPYGGLYDHLYLDIFPTGLQVAAPGHIERRQPLRPVAYDGPAGASVPLPQGHADAPLLYVTMGTVFNDPEPLRAAVAALSTLDARVLATVGPASDPAVLGPQPQHVSVVRYVPQTVVLPQCAVVVSHGGSGTVLATLALGLPQLCLPQGADQFLNAGAVAGSGAGIALAPELARPEAIADAVGQLLGDGSYADASRHVAASIAAMPPPEDVARVLEQLA